MKHKLFIRAGVFLVLLILVPYIPSQAREVKATGVGVAPIIKDEASARRAAMVLAKRDAVERALGAEVQAEAIPADELLRVVANTAGRLAFSVKQEGAEDDAYIVEIEAVVEIPPELESRYPLSLEEERTGYEPCIQKFPNGEVNWRDGFLLAQGLARKKGDDTRSIQESRRAAQVDAYAVALRMVAGIKFDPEDTARQRMEKAPSIKFRIMGLIRGAEVVDEKSLDKRTYQVTIKVPLRGIRGIQKVFTDTMNLKAPPEKAPPEKKDAEKTYTGIIVDARGMGLIPAIFPEIVDENGEPVYSIEKIDPQALTLRGAAAYVGEGEESLKNKKGSFLENKRFLAVPALTIESAGLYPVSFSRDGQKLFPIFSSHPIRLWQQIAQMHGRRLVLRQGTKPIRRPAIRSSGPTRSRIVISNSSATMIRQAVAYNDFLRKARVVVITDSMIGGTEGRYWDPGEYITASR
jgi:hypothetical protein